MKNTGKMGEYLATKATYRILDKRENNTKNLEQ